MSPSDTQVLFPSCGWAWLRLWWRLGLRHARDPVGPLFLNIIYDTSQSLCS